MLPILGVNNDFSDEAYLQTRTYLVFHYIESIGFFISK